MRDIFINLKRFDVPRNMGGLCPEDSPRKWIEDVIKESVELGIGGLKQAKVTYFLPESLIITAKEALSAYHSDVSESISLGCQGVYRQDVKVGGNFGAFTTNRPASAAKALGCSWSIIGHSEERKDKLDIIDRFQWLESEKTNYSARASKAVNSIINEEVICALERGINVLMCVGETEEERGNGSFEEQKLRIEKVLGEQLETGLKGCEKYISMARVVIGYEPVWAIGPGKIPPGGDYIGFVSSYIKSFVKEKFGFNPSVVYGGGLKEENASMLSQVETIDGGLIALTRFTGEIGFYVPELKKIIDKYLGQ